mgnify:CR=1 FL=1
MDIYEAMGRLANRLLERHWEYEAVTLVMDGICELPTRTEMEEAVCWLARDYGLLEMISGEEVASTETERALQVA